MTIEEHQQSLTNARLACEWFRRVADELPPGQARSEVECLIAEFTRLDEKEQRQAEAGRESGHLGAAHGRKGGRPKKTKNGGKK